MCLENLAYELVFQNLLYRQAIHLKTSQFMFCAPCFSSFQSVNKAMQKDVNELTIGVLDIYGFEIFQVN